MGHRGRSWFSASVVDKPRGLPLPRSHHNNCYREIELRPIQAEMSKDAEMKILVFGDETARENNFSGKAMDKSAQKIIQKDYFKIWE